MFCVTNRFSGLIRKSSWLISIILFGIFLYYPTTLPFLGGMAILLLHIFLFQEKMLALLIYGISFRGVDLILSENLYFNLYDLIIVLLFFWVIFKIKKNNLRVKLSARSAQAAFIFLLLLLPSFASTVNVQRSLLEFVRYLICVGLFLALQILLDSAEKILVFFKILRSVALFSCILVILDVLSQGKSTAVELKNEAILNIVLGPVSVTRADFTRLIGTERGTGFWGDPNYLGLFIATTLLAVGRRRNIGKQVSAVGFTWPEYLLGLFAIFLTKSAVSIVLSLSAILFVNFFSCGTKDWESHIARQNAQLVWRAIKIYIGLFMIAAVFVTGIFLLDSVTKVLGRPLNSYQNSLSNRLFFWSLSFKWIREHPWTGIGLDNFAHAFDQEFPGWPVVPPPHNSILHLTLGAGILGLTGLLLFIAMLLPRIYMAYKKGYTGLVIGLVYICLFGLFFEVLTARMLWIFLALTIAVSRSSVPSFSQVIFEKRGLHVK